MRNACHESSPHSGCRAVGVPGRQEHQAAQMRAPLCLLLLVAHAVDMLSLHRRKKQGTDVAGLGGIGAAWQTRSSLAGICLVSNAWVIDSGSARGTVEQLGPRKHQMEGVSGRSHCPHLPAVSQG
ncbi:hypothetical protein NN561_009823 [Cricetulus griseus]